MIQNMALIGRDDMYYHGGLLLIETTIKAQPTFSLVFEKSKEILK